MRQKEFQINHILREKIIVLQSLLVGTVGLLTLAAIITNRPEDPFCKEGDPILTILEETRSGRMNPEALKRYYEEEDLMVIARKSALEGNTHLSSAALYHAQPPLDESALTLSLAYKEKSNIFFRLSENPNVVAERRKKDREAAECLSRKSQALEERAKELGNS